MSTHGNNGARTYHYLVTLSDDIGINSTSVSLNYSTPLDQACALRRAKFQALGLLLLVTAVFIATSVADLHSANAKVGKDTSLTEKGEVVSGFGDEVNRHDILTGSRPDGTVAVPEPGKDTTCGNWTKSDGGSAIVGHHDHKGTNPDPVANASWNSSHGTRGCSVEQLQQSGSAGLMYCFATN